MKAFLLLADVVFGGFVEDYSTWVADEGHYSGIPIF